MNQVVQAIYSRAHPASLYLDMGAHHLGKSTSCGWTILGEVVFTFQLRNYQQSVESWYAGKCVVSIFDPELQWVMPCKAWASIQSTRSSLILQVLMIAYDCQGWLQWWIALKPIMKSQTASSLSWSKCLALSSSRMWVRIWILHNWKIISEAKRP